MTTRDSILLVDDDPSILKAMERTLAWRMDVTTAASSEAALRLFDDGATYSVIVSDLRLPGRSGLYLLQQMLVRFPDMVRVLISGEAQLRDAVAAVNEGHVFRLLTKPFNMSALAATVHAASDQHRLLTAERVLLEQTLQGVIKALTDMLTLVQPAAFGRAVRLRRHVADLCERVGVTRRWDVEVAALLSQVGCVTLDAGTLERWYNNSELTHEEQAQVARLPRVAEELIAEIPRLETVRSILRGQFGTPVESPFSMGAAILTIALDFDLLIAQGENAERALETMEGRQGRYNTDLLREFRAIRGKRAPAAVIREMRMLNVKEGMVFAADVHSPTGLLLIARGQRVSAALMDRIHQKWRDLAETRDVRMIVVEAAAAEVSDVPGLEGVHP